ncbi:lactonase family protein [Rhodopirellula bahusiensis]|uniref:3-carboxymuconate cyclase n=1 Tax=Rhodopirellula bahusiensis TaxID=2014065 RepID=A0A2G1W8M2_9BACT|nr:lactonase family protein [Rhodopirellula bahusiensis]PHQ35366.1 3-carboxymuconate cyclase [Rhodopirellula bahusiensis]
MIGETQMRSDLSGTRQSKATIQAKTGVMAGAKRVLGALVAVAALQGSSVMAETLNVWFGTTTPRGGASEGIYHATFDTESGKLSSASLAVKAQQPGFLAIHPSKPVLYAASGSGVTAYRVQADSEDAKLVSMGSVESGDGGVAHLSTDQTGNVLLSAQYGGGSTTLYELDDDGSVARRVSVYEHDALLSPAGSGVVGNRQNAPHAHWVGTSPDNRFAFTPDLGMDKVVIWKLDPNSPSLTHHGFGEGIPGGGPRHMKFSPDGKRIYLLNELTLSVTVFDYDAETGTMTAGQTIAALSEETKAKERFNSSSEIRVHPTGRFVYSANRGHDSISVFRVDESGQLHLVEVEAIRGGWPRNFNLDPSGRWLIAAGRDSHTATVFEVDANTGELTFTRQTQQIPTPICVLFSE